MNYTTYELYKVLKRENTLNQFRDKLKSQKDLTLKEKQFLLLAVRKFSHIFELQKQYVKIYCSVVRKEYIKIDKDAKAVHKLVPTRIAPFPKYKEHNTTKLKERSALNNERLNEINE